jgi:hypothetical protein
MSRLKPWLPLILIVLALLLSVVRSTLQPPPGRSVNVEQSNRSSGTVQSNPNNDPTATGESDQQKTTGVEQGNDYQKAPTEVKLGPVAVTKDWWDVALIVFTILFTGGLVVVGSLQVAWLKQQTKISRIGLRTNRLAVKVGQQSVQISRLALLAERPYVFIESQQVNISPHYSFLSLADITPKPTDDFDFKLKCVFWNRGKGIARVRGIQIRVLISPFFRVPIEPATQLEPIRCIEIKRDRRSRIIGPSANIEHSSIFQLQGRDRETTESQRMTSLIVVGIVSYEDVFHERYRTWFCLDYQPPFRGDKALNLPDLEGFLYPGLERYNRFS